MNVVALNAATPHDLRPAAGFCTARRPWDRAAYAAAIENGLMPGEVEEVLAGRRVTELFPVVSGEAPATYAGRAVAELMVAYLRYGAL